MQFRNNFHFWYDAIIFAKKYSSLFVLFHFHNDIYYFNLQDVNYYDICSFFYLSILETRYLIFIVQFHKQFSNKSFYVKFFHKVNPRANHYYCQKFFYLEITLEDWKVIQYFQEWPSVHQEFHLRIVLSCQIFFKAWVT